MFVVPSQVQHCDEFSSFQLQWFPVNSYNTHRSTMQGYALDVYFSLTIRKGRDKHNAAGWVAKTSELLSNATHSSQPTPW
jgi:hypothetical protein